MSSKYDKQISAKGTSIEIKKKDDNDGYRINYDIMKGEKMSSIRLLTWTSRISQFVQPVVWEGIE